MSSSPEGSEFTIEDFLRMTDGESIKIITGKYDWSKVIHYMKKKKNPVTVGEIKRQVMRNVKNTRQIRAWMERQVKKGIMVKGKHPRANRVFYVLRSIYEKYEKKRKKTGADT